MIWNTDSSLRNSESRASVCLKVRAAASPFPLPPSALAPQKATARRDGFTLVELLIVIAIIGILSALLLGVAATSAEQSRGSSTKSMIAKLHNLVMQQYDTYKDRRAPVNPSLQVKRSQQLAANRLNALRELMKMEMPDRWSDVLSKPVSAVSNRGELVAPQFLAPNTGSTYYGPTPLIEAYRRQYFAMIDAGVSETDILSNESAECLYMIVMFATADGEARGLFGENVIGDTDGDGAYEFLDAWGNPIGFIRWPAGFSSSKQLSVPALKTLVDRGSPEKAVEAIAIDHDPFDLFRVDQYPNPSASNPNPRAFRLVPLIYSRGSDEAAGIEEGPNFVPFIPSSDPYAEVSSGQWLGQSTSDESVDNITNHNLTGE